MENADKLEQIVEGVQNLKLSLEGVKQSLKESVSFNKQSLKELVACIVCHTITYSKILQCPNGHLTCNECISSGNLSTCPLCRTSLHLATRNLAVEQIIELMSIDFKCRNDGCGFSGSKEDLVQHQRTCEHKDNNNNDPNNTGFGMFIQASSN